jgi:hypothetical protein
MLEGLDWSVAALQECTPATATALRTRLPHCTLVSGPDLASTIEDPRYQANDFGSVLLVRPGGRVVESGLILPAVAAGLPAGAVPAPSRMVWSLLSFSDGSDLLAISAHAPHSGASTGAKRRFEVERKALFFETLQSWLVARVVPAVVGIDANLWIDDTPGLFDTPTPKPGDHYEMNAFIINGPERHGLADTLRTYLDGQPKMLASIRAQRPSGPLAVTHYRGRGSVRTAERFDAVLASDEFTVHGVHHDYEGSHRAGSDHSYVLADLELGAVADRSNHPPSDGRSGTEPAGALSPMRINCVYVGEGTDVVRIDPPSEWPGIVAHCTVAGEGHCSISALDESGERIDRIVNTVGDYSGTTLLNRRRGREPVALEVTGRSHWKVELASVDSSRPLDQSVAGLGDDVLRYDGPFRVASVSHGGAGHFAVRSVAPRPQTLVNQVGPFAGRVRFPAGPATVVVHASGPWSIDLTEL